MGRLGLEPRTNAFKGRCSTIELPTRKVELRRVPASGHDAKHFFSEFQKPSCQRRIPDAAPRLTREHRGAFAEADEEEQRRRDSEERKSVLPVLRKDQMDAEPQCEIQDHADHGSRNAG